MLASGPSLYCKLHAGSAVLNADIDGSGGVEALIDGLPTLRYELGLRGDALIEEAVNLDDCTRCSAEDIEKYLRALMP